MLLTPLADVTYSLINTIKFKKKKKVRIETRRLICDWRGCGQSAAPKTAKRSS